MGEMTRLKATRRASALMVGFGLGASLGLTGCGSEDGSERANEQETEPVRDARTITELTPELEPAIRSTNRLASELYRVSDKAGKNLFFSPFSINVALGMTYAGTRGETADEIRALLALEDADDGYHHALGALNADLTGPHRRGYQLLSANALFGERTTTFAAPYVDLLDASYAAPLQQVSFITNAEGARATVNEWVRQGTNDKIPELVPKGVFTADTRFALVNAVSFLSTWHAQFDVAGTTPRPFLLENGSEVITSTMSSRGRYGVASDEHFHLLELDYADRELSMGLLVPRVRGGLHAVEAELDAERIDALFGSAGVTDCTVWLPRFEFRAELPLIRLLPVLGMTTAFGADADFTGMVEEFDPDYRRLYLTDALHQAYVRVDEAGTEAAAATAFVGGVVSVEQSCEVRADHPFAFVIRDRATSALLFMGRVADPTWRGVP